MPDVDTGVPHIARLYDYWPRRAPRPGARRAPRLG
jgi:hypothetical protein